MKRIDKGETLADHVIRETLRPKTSLPLLTARPMSDIRAAMLAAKKFVLDDRMSSFMADLQTVPFMADNVRRSGVLDIMRHGAMIPHHKTWIEFNGRAFRGRLLEINPEARDPWKKALVDTGEVPNQWGWLLEEHPRLPNIITLTEFAHSPEDEENPTMVLPFTVVWNTQDEPLPWNDCDTVAASIAHGVMGYDCKQIGVRLSQAPDRRLRKHMMEIMSPEGKVLTTTHMMVGECAGIARYALSLLSTLNDIPVLNRDVRPHRGYIARGQHKKFVEHTVISLNVPIRSNTRLLAKKVFVQSRRRLHKVRGHWRNYLRAPGQLCTSMHAWGPMDDTGHAKCTRCVAWRTWISEHDRGDSTLGVVTHDYNVTHH